MPKDEFDVEDPFEAVAVELPADEDTLTPMAECFIEEFMRMGYSAERILVLFTNPMYSGPLLFTKAHGMVAVRQLIAETFTKWGRCSCASVKRSDAELMNDTALHSSASTTPRE